MDFDQEKLSKKPFVTVAEVAALLGCTEKTVYRMVERGKLPSPKAVGGGNPRFPSRMIAAWLVWQEYVPGDLDEDESDEPQRRKS